MAGMELSTFLFVVFLLLLFCIYIYLQRKIKKEELGTVDLDKIQPLLTLNSAQQEDVWNISSRVNNQGPANAQNHPWPTHDGHVSMEAIIIDPMKDLRPGYNDPPPSYEQAVALAATRTEGQSSGQQQNPTQSVPATQPSAQAQEPPSQPQAPSSTRTESS